MKVLWTDASGFGGGSMHEVYDPLTDRFVPQLSTYCWDFIGGDHEINFKELFMVAAALERHGPAFRGAHLTVMWDNECTCHIWKK